VTTNFELDSIRPWNESCRSTVHIGETDSDLEV
jgi:hypothetical protein